MKVTQRQVTLGLLGLLSLASLLTSLLLIVGIATTGTSGYDQSVTITTSIACLIIISMLVAYWRGWELARYIVLIAITLVIGLTTPEPFVTEAASITIFIPPALALILATPIWVVGSAATTYIILLFRAGGAGTYANPVTIIITVIVIGGIVLGRLITETAQRNAEDQARRADAEKARAEAQALELADANELMTQQLDQQQELLDLVATLEAPAVPLADGVLFAPMVGHIDERRAETMTNRLLQDVSNQRARLIVLDISGVKVMDTSVAQALMNTIRAIRLLGCEVTLSGISAAVAITLIHLGISLDGIATSRSPQEALNQYLSAAKLPQTTNGNGKTFYN
ncbi:MAG TPA: STAS domain-containing protein [Roseiflexaceae bacterium]|nr:STAS domain-containing protein [Roseiflexaceae bacterium]